MKLDDMLSFSKKNKKMTSLLGNMFTKGIDKDHSHGIELPASAVDSSDESESESVEKAEDDDAVLFDPEDGSVARNEQDLDLGTSYTEVISRDLSTAESETESCAPEEPNERFCTGTISNKGAILDDNSSMGSSTKKKFMEVYRDDSDDESVSSKKSTEHLSLNVTEASSLDLDEGENNVEVTLTEVDSSDANKASISCEELATDTADDKEPLRLNIVALAPNVDTGLIDDELNDVQTNDSSNESDDDDVAINEELAAKIKQQGIVDALEEIATGEEIPVVLEEEKVEDDQSDEESEPGDVWEYATALEGQDYSPYRCLVCMPPSLERSANVGTHILPYMHLLKLDFQL